MQLFPFIHRVLGLTPADIIQTGEDVTWKRVRLIGEIHRVLCPKCSCEDYLSDGRPTSTIVVADTPAHGRPCEIELHRYRYRCSACSYSFTANPSSIHLKRRMTNRLVRYIEDRSPRETRTAIAQEVGLSEDRVTNVVRPLAKRLAQNHKFPTPRVLGIDDIKLNRKTYHVLTDAETGFAIGLIDSGESGKVLRWMHLNLEMSNIKIIVSDLGKAPLAVARRLPNAVLLHDSYRVPDSLHVADRWHVLKGCRAAAAKVFRQELAALEAEASQIRKAGILNAQNPAHAFAQLLKSHRIDLIGRRRKRNTVGEQTLIDEQSLHPVLTANRRISLAFYARVSLAKVYDAPTIERARIQLGTFYRQAGHHDVAAEFEPMIKQVHAHQELILNFVRARIRFPDIDPTAFTTSSTERRNGFIRWSWKSARGATDYEYLRLMALYQPWRLDKDIVECSEAGCSAIEGPVGLIEGLVGQDPAGPLTGPSGLHCVRHHSRTPADAELP